MALLQNQTILGQFPLRFVGGTISPSRALWGRGDRRNGLNAVDSKAAIPNGYLAPGAWVLPRKPGGLSSHGRGAGAITAASANLAQGMALAGSASPALTVPAATASALAPLAGSAAMALTVPSATGVGIASMTGTASAALTASGSMAGPTAVSGSTSAALTTSATLTATAFMIAVPIDTALSEDAIAAAVWAAIASGNNAPGTMGELLNVAGAGGISGAVIAQIADAVWDWADTVAPGSKGEELAKALRAAKLAAALSA